MRENSNMFNWRVLHLCIKICILSNFNTLLTLTYPVISWCLDCLLFKIITMNYVILFILIQLVNCLRVVSLLSFHCSWIPLSGRRWGNAKFENKTLTSLLVALAKDLEKAVFVLWLPSSTEMETRTSLRMEPRQKKEEQKKESRWVLSVKNTRHTLRVCCWTGYTLWLWRHSSISPTSKNLTWKNFKDFHFTTRNKAKISWDW